MSDIFVSMRAGFGRRRSSAAAAIIALALGIAVFGIASSSASSAPVAHSSAKTKLIMFELSFPCGLNEYASNLCKGVQAAAKKLPPGFKLQIKTGRDYGDTVAYNNLIQTSMQLNPAGLIIFPNGPSAQVPVLKRACAKGAKVIIFDSPAKGLGKCQSAFLGADHYQLGAMDGRWLIKHPPASKQVGIVTLPPGQYVAADERSRGFKETVEAKGFKVVATAITDNSLDKTRTQVTNMLTAHPNIGAIFSANGPMGQGTARALKGNKKVIQLSVDGFLADVRSILRGEQSANAAQNSYRMGLLSVQQMVKLLQGKKIPAKTSIPGKLIDKSNAKEYLRVGGLR